jgi:hypothetical protein
MEFYSNMAGTDFLSGAAMRAAVAQARKGREQGKARAGSPHGITDFPHDRDLGSNTVGDNPGVRLGDTTDTRTFGEKMTGEPAFGRNSGQEANDTEESRGDEILDEMMEDADDYQDAVRNATDVAHDFSCVVQGQRERIFSILTMQCSSRRRHRDSTRGTWLAIPFW